MTLLKTIYAIAQKIRNAIVLRISGATAQEEPPDTRKVIEDIVQRIETKMQACRELPSLRDQHAKQHGCVWAEFMVEDGLPEKVKVGIFQEPKAFPAWIRFSSLGEWDDSKGDTQALAIKLMGIEGEQAIAAADGKTQDFIMVNHPVFPIKNAADFRERQGEEGSSKASQCPFKRASSGLSAWIPFLFPGKNPFKWRWREFSIVAAMACKKVFKKPASPLEVQYWSMSPYQLENLNPQPSNQAIKFYVKPAPENQFGKSVQKNSHYLREVMAEHLERREAYFDFYIQLQSDPNKMPVEDPRIEWKGAEEYKVATIRIPAQKFDTPEQMAFGENLSYTPWHALAAHKPIGEINQVRKEAYQRAAKLRRSRNGADQQEPTADTHQPHLLDPQLPHNALTVIVPIQPGKEQQLRQLLNDVEDAIKAGFRKYSPSTHFARWVILRDPDDAQSIVPHLLFTSSYDGRFDFYVRELVELAKKNRQIDEIWKMCRDYRSGSCFSAKAYQEFLCKHSSNNKKPDVFYTAYRNRTVSTILNSSPIYEKVERILSCKSIRSAIDKTASSLVPDASPAVKSSASKLSPRIKKGLRILEFIIGIRWQHRDLQKAIELREQLLVDGSRYQELRETEDRGCQNELTTLVAIKSCGCSKLILKGMLCLASVRAAHANGSLSGITSIHFLRWVIFDLKTISRSKKSYLFFESSYDGSWDSYIDDFVKNVRPIMNLVWGNCINFPKGGCEDIELFKHHIRYHQFPAQIFYSAYPNLTVLNNLANLKRRDIAAQVLHHD